MLVYCIKQRDVYSYVDLSCKTSTISNIPNSGLTVLFSKTTDYESPYIDDRTEQQVYIQTVKISLSETSKSHFLGSVLVRVSLIPFFLSITGLCMVLYFSSFVTRSKVQSEQDSSTIAHPCFLLFFLDHPTSFANHRLIHGPRHQK